MRGQVRAVFAVQALQAREAFLEPVHAAGLGVQPAEVVAKREGEFLDAGVRRVRMRQDRLEAAVVSRHLLKRPAKRRELFQNGAFGFVKALVSAGGRLEQFLGVLEGVDPFPERVRLAVFRCGPLDLVALEPELLGAPVGFAADCVGDPARRALDAAGPGGVVLLENLRFHAAEEGNDPAFAAALAALAELYVNDAFGAAHRAHASTAGVVAHVREAAAGLLMAAELEHLGSLLGAPARPFVAVLGGAKVSGKLDVIENLLGRVDALLIGGAMAYTFFERRGLPVGRSLVEPDLLDAADGVERDARGAGVDLWLPADHVVTERVEAGAAAATLSVDDAAIGERIGVDIGPRTRQSYAEIVGLAGTVVWNGPLGVFEIDAFAAGTLAMARAVAGTAATTVVGGGDSVAAVAKAGVRDRITHISTGGGASLEFLAGRTLPGVSALPDA